ncbi:MAG: helix-turn-helix domain-containing protein [Candidatus Micrarchaeia archaeon]
MQIPTMLEMRKWRERLGKTQVEVAKALGITQSYLARIESGTANPGYNLVLKIANLYSQWEFGPGETITNKYHKGVEYVGPMETVAKAASHMKWKGYSQMPVIEQGKCIGSISESLINKKMREMNKDELYRIPIKNIMEAPFMEVNEDCPLALASDMLRHVPLLLVKNGNRYVGVITKSDLL